MKRYIAIATVCIIGIGVGLISQRRWIITKFWHWRHGNSVIVGNYVVPVPENWFAQQNDASGNTLIYGIEKPHNGRSAAGVSVIAVALSSPPLDLDALATNERQLMRDHGLGKISETSFGSGDLRFICLGGSEFRDEMHLPSDALSITCWSNSQLRLIFTGDPSQLDQFYAIASQVRGWQPLSSAFFIDQDRRHG